MSKFIAALKSCFVLKVAVLLLVASGCGGPTLVTVEGKITLNGQPLVDGNVTLQATEGPVDRRFYQATTDSAGQFAISPSWSNATGAPPGTYKVFIKSVEAPPDADENTKLPPEPIPVAYRDGSQTLKVPEKGITDVNWDIRTR